MITKKGYESTILFLTMNSSRSIANAADFIIVIATSVITVSLIQSDFVKMYTYMMNTDFVNHCIWPLNYVCSVIYSVFPVAIIICILAITLLYLLNRKELIPSILRITKKELFTSNIAILIGIFYFLSVTSNTLYCVSEIYKQLPPTEVPYLLKGLQFVAILIGYFITSIFTTIPITIFHYIGITPTVVAISYFADSVIRLHKNAV
jgi:hypothetical protein